MNTTPKTSKKQKMLKIIGDKRRGEKRKNQAKKDSSHSGVTTSQKEGKQRKEGAYSNNYFL